METNSGPIRVGVLGLGRSGYGIHINALRHMGETFQLVGVYDTIEARAAGVAAEFGVTAYASEEQLLRAAEVELVVVASPNRFHAGQAERALAAGKHVLCEKPFGLTAEQADQIIAASRQAGKVLQPFQQRRYEEDFCKVKEVCASGLLGDIHVVRIAWHGFKRRWDWQTLRRHAGGALNNNGPHPLDHALELFGDGTPEVWAEARRVLCSGDAEDHLKVILYGAGHPTVEIELTDAFAYTQDRWYVCGSAGGLRGTTSKLAWKWVDWSAMPERPVIEHPTPDRSYNSEELAWHEDAWSAAGGADAGGGAAPAVKPVVDLYGGMYRAIREGKPQEITPESVRRRIAVLEKIREAAGIPALA